MDCRRPGSSVHRISQARILEWVTISLSRGSSQPRDQTHGFCIGRQILYGSALRQVPHILMWLFGHSLASHPLQSHGLWNARLSCPSPSPGACSNSCPLCSAGDLSSVPVSGRSPGEGKGYSCQYSGLENSTESVVHGVTRSWT